MTTKSLLVELFVEELPPKALDKLQRNFAESIVASLRAQGLAPADGAFASFGTPRRLGVLIQGVAGRAADFKVPKKILILDEIPKGATGKLQRIGLAEKLGLV